MSTQPALRISNIVYGRETVGTRVYYFIDPRRNGTQKAVPETVVLKRWRQRQLDGYQFRGARLSSTLWRAIRLAFPPNAQTACELELNEVRRILERKHAELKKYHYRLPSEEVLHALLSILGPDRLTKLVSRHMAQDYAGHSGVPDLFLYAVKQANGTPCIHRFVEVKKPGEQVSDDQRAEISFLNALNLKARVLRLIERH